MENLDLLYFEQLKIKIEQRFLEENTPSNPSISKWKGIDIIYFQEDLRKKAKGNISEKSFYTYFKSKNVSKLPRIDMLNILSIYAGYNSWFDFRKNNVLDNEIHKKENISITKDEKESNLDLSEEKEKSSKENEVEKDEISILQNSIHVNQQYSRKEQILPNHNTTKNNVFFIRKWIAFALILLLIFTSVMAIYWKNIFGTTYTYSFRDADRNGIVNIPLNIKLIKANESPMFYRIEPGQDFVYSSKDRVLQMEISSPLYENLVVTRNLDNAPDKEIIILKPDDYKSSVYYYSKKGIPGNTIEALEQIKLKRRELERRISDNAIIYQVFDNSIYGIETLDKERYITLVTTPTTSLKNLTFLDVKTEQGKIISIKFKIKDDE